MTVRSWPLNMSSVLCFWSYLWSLFRRLFEKLVQEGLASSFLSLEKWGPFSLPHWGLMYSSMHFIFSQPGRSKKYLGQVFIFCCGRWRNVVSVILSFWCWIKWISSAMGLSKIHVGHLVSSTTCVRAILWRNVVYYFFRKNHFSCSYVESLLWEPSSDPWEHSPSPRNGWYDYSNCCEGQSWAWGQWDKNSKFFQLFCFCS